MVESCIIFQFSNEKNYIDAYQMFLSTITLDIAIETLEE